QFKPEWIPILPIDGEEDSTKEDTEFITLVEEKEEPKVIEDTTTIEGEDEEPDATIQEASLKEETERYFIDEPTPLPLESVHFTLKNGVAVIVLQDTVKTRPLDITTLPELPEKPPDPPPHPIIAHFSPQAPPPVRPRSLVSDPTPVPPPPEPPDLNSSPNTVLCPPPPLPPSLLNPPLPTPLKPPPPRPPDSNIFKNINEELILDEISFAIKLIEIHLLKPPGVYFAPAPPPKPPDKIIAQSPPPVPPSSSKLLLPTPFINPAFRPPAKPPDIIDPHLLQIFSRGFGTTGTINSLGDKLHPSLCHLSPTKQIPPTETCHVSHYVCKCTNTPNTLNRTTIPMCQLLSNFKNSKLASNVPITSLLTASYVHWTKFSFNGLPRLGLRVMGHLCLLWSQVSSQHNFDLINPPRTHPTRKPPDLYLNLEDKVQVNPAAMIED
ncbi:hypothetical protein L195_g046326, partial [Trifolium pratense]